MRDPFVRPAEGEILAGPSIGDEICDGVCFLDAWNDAVTLQVIELWTEDEVDDGSSDVIGLKPGLAESGFLFRLSFFCFIRRFWN